MCFMLLGALFPVVIIKSFARCSLYSFIRFMMNERSGLVIILFSFFCFPGDKQHTTSTFSFFPRPLRDYFEYISLFYFVFVFFVYLQPRTVYILYMNVKKKKK
jgi:hypothetical protein